MCDVNLELFLVPKSLVELGMKVKSRSMMQSVG